jgi:hypothetical protein
MGVDLLFRVGFDVGLGVDSFGLGGVVGSFVTGSFGLTGSERLGLLLEPK